MKTKTWRIAGINFDHFHMGDLLRMAADHPQAEVVGISDEQPRRMEEAIRKLGIPREHSFTDYRACFETTKPDIVILCPAASKHGEWVRKVAPYGVHIMVEKPFAATLREADAMIKAMPAGKTLMINWPLQWVRSHRKAYAFVEGGVIGDVLNVWHFGGNRGPLWHGADKEEKTPAQVAREKPHSWFYKKAHGGGSLLDYLGYGTTLDTWYQGRRALKWMNTASWLPAMRTACRNSRRVGARSLIRGRRSRSRSVALLSPARTAQSAVTITTTM